MKKYILLISLFVFTVVTGCGGSEGLASFQESINSFYTEVSEIEKSMEQIDEQDENAVTTLLICLEQMKAQFEILAQMEVPAEFSNVEELAKDAAEYMSEATRLYTEAYEEDLVNNDYVQAAVDNYESAMKRIDYIATLLQGEIPEGAVVIEGEGNEFEPYTEEE